ncbi:MAG: integral membrane sensor signal transduction histidine [Beijerinckiaceae bacterium]|nr:MAG: integral membrane sensor signal transduction histidine [Beijerinckiaceae bacterium]
MSPGGHALTRLRSLLDGLAARTILIVLIGIGAVHLLSLWTYRHALTQQAEVAGDERLADQLLGIKRAVMREPQAAREAVAHDLSGGPLEAHWSQTEHATPGGPGAEQWQGLAERLKQAAPELAENGIIIGANRRNAADPHLAIVSMKLPDESWLNVSLISLTPRPAEGHGTFLSTTLMALGAVLVSVVLVRWLTRPLSTFAAAAKEFSGAGAPVTIPEEGPREVRALASAFNEMQQRISRLVEDRTQALAAVSHDLKTPITRLRFRAEDIADPALSAAISEDLGDMERMLDQTLAYLRGERTDEAMQPVDLAAILATVCGDLSDAGCAVALEGSRSAVLDGRRLSLKRAFGNIIENAVKYGDRADVVVTDTSGVVIVTIADEGPGIAPEDREKALAPFVRLEPSRNQETGGFGLGLTIAKTIIAGHGGTLDLTNREEGGLLVTVHLPKGAQSTP